MLVAEPHYVPVFNWFLKFWSQMWSFIAILLSCCGLVHACTWRVLYCCTCSIHGVHMTCTCRIHDVFICVNMTCGCRIHDVHMTCTYRIHCVNVTCTCRIHNVHMTCTYRIYYVQMACACRVHFVKVTYMYAQCGRYVHVFNWCVWRTGYMSRSNVVYTRWRPYNVCMIEMYMYMLFIIFSRPKPESLRS